MEDPSVSAFKLGSGVRGTGRRWLRIAMIILLAAGLAGGKPAQAEDPLPPLCWLGVVAVNPTPQSYPLGALRASAVSGIYADPWRAVAAGAGVEYAAVLRVGDASFESTLASLPGWIAAHPGAAWLIGDEPDNPNLDHDKIPAATYASRYYQLAAWIRGADPHARLGFGGITQPSSIRLRYLEHAWQALLALSGGQSARSGLVDFWAIHVFPRNETGILDAGIPPGEESQGAITDYSLADAYSHDRFEQDVESFRGWMEVLGEKEKPLWVSAYGMLENNGQDFEVSRYLIDTFDYLSFHRDALSGLASDGGRLVQRWFWHSLDGGGALVSANDPQALTIIGSAYSSVYQSRPAGSDLLVSGIEARLQRYTNAGTTVDELVTVSVGNTGGSVQGTLGTVSLYDGAPDLVNQLNLIGSAPIAEPLPGCGAAAHVQIPWSGATAFRWHDLYALVEMPAPEIDPDPSNNTLRLTVFTGAPPIYLPLVWNGPG